MYIKNYLIILTVNTICAIMLMFSKGQVVYGHEPNEIVNEIEIEQRASVERIIQYNVIDTGFIINVTQQDIDVLMKIVEAEAGCEDRKGKLLVANVVINRVKNKSFPNSVKEVVYQKNEKVTQFSPVSNGRINKVCISEETKEVVYSALRGEDASKGALFFMSRKYADPSNIEWFDNNLKFLFSHGGHDFYVK